MALILLRKHSHPTQKRREGEQRRNSKRGIKTLPSSTPPVERTVTQELAFPATAEDAFSTQFLSLTRPMDTDKLYCQIVGMFVGLLT